LVVSRHYYLQDNSPYVAFIASPQSTPDPNTSKDQLSIPLNIATCSSNGQSQWNPGLGRQEDWHFQPPDIGLQEFHLK
jgi:hypothetical protein